MGFKCFKLFLVWVPFCVFTVVTAREELTICEIQECKCNNSKAVTWKIITCNLSDTQVLNFEYVEIPKETAQIFVLGGKELQFSSEAFNTLPGLTLIHINGVKKVMVERNSLFDIYSPTIVVEIINCGEIIIKSGAFKNIQSSISTEIIYSNLVTIEQGAFSKLSNGTFKFIKKLILSEGSFVFKNQGNIGRHGPATIILFDNVYIPRIPKEVFLTSLASVTFHNCKIDDMHSESFKATQISAVSMINTSLEHIHRKAFTSRTLICEFKIMNCNIYKLHSEAIMAAIGNLTVSHSSIMDIETRAIDTTVAKAEIVKNYIARFHTMGFVFNNWNKIVFDDNIVTRLHENFMETSINSDIELFSFKRNEMSVIDPSAFSCISKLDDKILFADNLFNKSCACSIYKWLEGITNSSEKANIILNTSACFINNILSQCFSIPVGIINMRNFTEKACHNVTICSTDNYEISMFDESNRIYLKDNKTEKQKWLLFTIIMVGLSLTFIIFTLAVIITKGSRWLKIKAHFRNIQYNSNPEITNENIIDIENENDKLQMPDELTIEFLQMLSKKLDSPKTHHAASEMIEKLYEMFIVEDNNYENNNMQNEEAHLYEELGNLNSQMTPPDYIEPKNIHGPRNILKIMEEKFKTHCIVDHNASPILTGDYSEPTDTEIHLYSELKQNIKKNNEINKDSKDMLIPLQNITNDLSIIQAGPSFKK